jgi:hypothetical protein
MCSSAVIHHLQELHLEDPRTATIYFFFDFRDSHKQNCTNMVRSLIVQLSGVRPDTPESLKSLRRFYNTNSQPRKDALVKAIQDTTKGFSDVYLIIDALDECPEEENQRDDLLSMLKTIHGWSQANLHMLLTSRMVPSITVQLEELFEAPVPGSGVINLEHHQSDIDGDITVFIDNKLKTGKYQILCKARKDIEAEIKDTLVKKANGMHVIQL